MTLVSVNIKPRDGVTNIIDTPEINIPEVQGYSLTRYTYSTEWYNEPITWFDDKTPTSTSTSTSLTPQFFGGNQTIIFRTYFIGSGETSILYNRIAISVSSGQFFASLYFDGDTRTSYTGGTVGGTMPTFANVLGKRHYVQIVMNINSSASISLLLPSYYQTPPLNIIYLSFASFQPAILEAVHSYDDPQIKRIRGNVHLNQIGHGHEVFLRSVSLTHLQPALISLRMSVTDEIGTVIAFGTTSDLSDIDSITESNVSTSVLNTQVTLDGLFRSYQSGMYRFTIQALGTDYVLRVNGADVVKPGDDKFGNVILLANTYNTFHLSYLNRLRSYPFANMTTDINVIENYTFKITKPDLPGLFYEVYSAYFGGYASMLIFFDNTTPYSKGYTSDFYNLSTSTLGVITNDPNINDVSIRWSGFFTARYSGIHRFTVASDDTSFVYINNAEVVNNGGQPHSFRYQYGNIELTAGTPVPITIYFGELSGSNEFQFGVLEPQPDGTQPYANTTNSNLFTTNFTNLPLLHASLPAYYAFNEESIGHVSAPSYPSHMSTKHGVVGEWVEMECPYPIVLSSFTITPGVPSYASNPQNLQVFGKSLDGNWYSIFTKSDNVSIASETEFSVAPHVSSPHTSFTFIVTSTAGASHFHMYISCRGSPLNQLACGFLAPQSDGTSTNSTDLQDFTFNPTNVFFSSIPAVDNTLVFKYNDQHFESLRLKSHYNQSMLCHRYDTNVHLGQSRGDSISFTLEGELLDTQGDKINELVYDDIEMLFQIENSFT